jgi:hypothetical protein
MISKEENSWFVHQSSLAILTVKSSSNKAGGADKGYEFGLTNFFFFLSSKGYLTCNKILRHGADRFNSPPKGGVLQILSPLKIHSPHSFQYLWLHLIPNFTTGNNICMKFIILNSLFVRKYFLFKYRNTCTSFILLKNRNNMDTKWTGPCLRLAQ